MSLRYLCLVALLGAACEADSPPRGPGTFSFAVLGDAPYVPLDQGRFRRVIRQLSDADLALVIHVGDILWYPCSDSLYQARLAAFQAVRHPLIYTPGDNEWTDCHEATPGAWDPLDRLTRLREIFFAEPARSLGENPIAVTVQSANPEWPEFVENVRWFDAGFVFTTVHLVGSRNGLAAYAGRTDRHDMEVRRRTAAAAAWLRSAFALADSVGAVGVVVATHADLDFDQPADDEYRQAYEPFLEALELAVEGFDGPVLLMHGDSHEFIVDHPLRRRTTGRVLENFTRMEVFGSPDVGWVEVTVDTGSVELFRFTPHRVPWWRFW